MCHSYVTQVPFVSTRMPIAFTSMSLVIYSYVICISLICHSYTINMYLHIICMSLMCHLYVTCMYSYATRMSLVCTGMSFVCHSYVLVCTRMSFECHSYVPVCHSYVTRIYSYVTCMCFTINLNFRFFYFQILYFFQVYLARLK